jgi:L-ribulose-5-phosphate 3-epimerase
MRRHAGGGDARKSLTLVIAEEAHALSETAPFLISLAQWSLHRRILGPALPLLRGLYEAHIASRFGPPDSFRGDLDPLDFPVVARREFGIGAVEYIGYFYATRVRNTDYLRELKTRAEGEGVRSLVVACGAEGAIGDPDTKKRRDVVQRHLKWLDMAAYLGCHSVSVRVASAGAADEQASLVADGLRDLADWSASHGLNVLIENHYGLSSDGAWLAETFKLVDRPNVGVSPDWGNFEPADADRLYTSVAEMMPYARAVTAKCYDFDPRGNETTLDFPRLVRIATEAKYRGHLGIEYEGERLSEADGILACKALLERIQKNELAPAL